MVKHKNDWKTCTIVKMGKPSIKTGRGGVRDIRVALKTPECGTLSFGRRPTISKFDQDFFWKIHDTFEVGQERKFVLDKDKNAWRVSHVEGSGFTHSTDDSNE